jgi:hypothetical protein
MLFKPNCPVGIAYFSLAIVKIVGWINEQAKGCKLVLRLS